MIITKEEVKKIKELEEDLVKEVTNDDIANMLQRIHHENCIIFSAIAMLAQIDDSKTDLVVDDWIEKFKKAKGE
jgi:hypothetical protein